MVQKEHVRLLAKMRQQCRRLVQEGPNKLLLRVPGPQGPLSAPVQEGPFLILRGLMAADDSWYVLHPRDLC